MIKTGPLLFLLKASKEQFFSINNAIKEMFTQQLLVKDTLLVENSTWYIFIKCQMIQ